MYHDVLGCLVAGIYRTLKFLPDNYNALWFGDTQVRRGADRISKLRYYR